MLDLASSQIGGRPHELQGHKDGGGQLREERLGLQLPLCKWPSARLLITQEHRAEGCGQGLLRIHAHLMTRSVKACIIISKTSCSPPASTSPQTGHELCDHIH